MYSSIIDNDSSDYYSDESIQLDLNNDSIISTHGQNVTPDSHLTVQNPPLPETRTVYHCYKKRTSKFFETTKYFLD